jgi:hypothetical protein
LATTSARADYLLTPFSGGNSTLSVAPGDSFTLDLVLTGGALDTHTSATFNVQFSIAGLDYIGYSWAGTHIGAFDNSSPGIGDLPILIADTTYGSLGSPIDVHLESFTFNAFDTGTLVSLALKVPSDFGPLPASITISAIPETFVGDLGSIPTDAGPSFELRIVPEPSALALAALGLASLIAVARQRKCR